MFFTEAMARALSDQGVTTIFGVVGDANVFIMDAFQRDAGGTYVAMASEAGAVMAANGFARRSGDLGVATVTHGPGLTNTITALVDGVRGRTPMVLVAGDTSTEAAWNLQDIAQRDLVISAGAGFQQVRTPASGVRDVATAVRRARTERRPIVLNVPYNLQWQQVEYEPVRTIPAPRQAVSGDPAALDAAVGIIANADRPIVLGGRGATSLQARQEVLRLAERIGAPVATTVLAKDLFRGEPHNLGICGTASHEVCLKTIADSDCIIAFGAGLNPRTTVNGSLFQDRRIVQVDADPAAIGQWCDVTAGVVGDTATVARTIVAWLDEAEVKPTTYASPALAEQLSHHRIGGGGDLSSDFTVDQLTALRRIDEAFPAERSLVLDGGRFIHNTFTLLHVTEPQAYVHTVNFGAIGLSMGAAVGAAMASPSRPVLVAAGDGGFMLGGLQEFNTAVRHGLDIVVVIFNDSSYGAEHIQLRNKDMDPDISMFDWPDFGPVAEALGGHGFTVRNLVELDEVLDAVAHRDRPVLIDVKLDPDQVTIP